MGVCLPLKCSSEDVKHIMLISAENFQEQTKEVRILDVKKFSTKYLLRKEPMFLILM